MRRFARLSLPLLLTAAACSAETIPVPNANFEQVGPSRVDTGAGGYVPASGPGIAGLPAGWTAYQWGAPGARYSTAIERGAGRNGSSALRCTNLSPDAKAGAYTHLNLAGGRYRVTVWARTETGQTANAAVYFANRYSRQFRLTDRWTQLELANQVDQPVPNAELNVQHGSGAANTVWFDDLQIQLYAPVRYSIVPDNRPASERPRTLLFSPISVNYLRDTAATWAARGFKGFLFDAIMPSWESDVWATDGDPRTRGEDDRLLQEVRACNAACRAQGIGDNFIKVAFYKDLPDWFDDRGWDAVCQHFADGARFARLSGCAGLALDVEYTAKQYNPSFRGNYGGRSLAETRAKVRERIATCVRAMLAEYPSMVLLTLPDGFGSYGEYYVAMFEAMVSAMAGADAPGGMHLLAEGSYHITEPAAMGLFRNDLAEAVMGVLDANEQSYWQRRCSLAMGVWPLGYYRELHDASGRSVGYGGRREVYGDRNIGSYGDKGPWYSPQVFATQMAAANTFSGRYDWIYAHGDVFWQLSPEESRRYQGRAHKPGGNPELPTTPDLNAYFDVIAHPGIVVRQ